MKVSLVVLSAGKASGQAIPIVLPQFVIGRDPQCNLRPASALISKKHCAVRVRQGRVFVQDFESTNGTFLNEKPVKGEVELKHNDNLKVGPLSFRVSIEGQPAAHPTPKPQETTTAAAAAVAKGKADPAKTPPPQTILASAKSNAPDEVDAASLLLEMGEGESGDPLSDSQIPGGSTIMEMPIPPELSAAAAAAETKPETAAKSPTPLPENKPPTPAPEKKPEPKKSDAGSAQNAAKALLEKMYRRNRPAPGG